MPSARSVSVKTPTAGSVSSSVAVELVAPCVSAPEDDPVSDEDSDAGVEPDTVVVPDVVVVVPTVMVALEAASVLSAATGHPDGAPSAALPPDTVIAVPPVKTKFLFSLDLYQLSLPVVLLVVKKRNSLPDCARSMTAAT